MIELEQVTKVYDNGTKALDCCSFSIGDNECLAILGHNGSGKTTLLRLMLGLLDPTSGRIVRSGGVMRSETAAVMDGDGCFGEMTVRDNMKFFASLYGYSYSKVKDVFLQTLEFFNLTDKINTRFHALSTGQKRIISLSRAVLTEPKFLIIDELITGLDPENQYKLIDFLRDYQRRKQCTVLFSSHDLLKVQKLVDRAVFLSAGKVITSMNMAEMGSYRKITLSGSESDLDQFASSQLTGQHFFKSAKNQLSVLVNQDKASHLGAVVSAYPVVFSTFEDPATLEDFFLAYTR